MDRILGPKAADTIIGIAVSENRYEIQLGLDQLDEVVNVSGRSNGHTGVTTLRHVLLAARDIDAGFTPRALTRSPDATRTPPRLP